MFIQSCIVSSESTTCVYQVCHLEITLSVELGTQGVGVIQRYPYWCQQQVRMGCHNAR